MDQDKWQMRAVKAVFSQATILLCIWHINKKIYAKMAPLLKKELKISGNIDSAEISEFLQDAYAPFETDWWKVVTG